LLATFLIAVACNPESTKVAVKEVKVTPSPVTIVVGESKQLSAEVLPSNATDKSVRWGSSHPEVAMVSSDGLVLALKPGRTNITATAGEQYGYSEVTVEAQFVPVSRVTLSEAAVEITEGESVTITAVVEPDDATDPFVQWTSSDEKIATVNGGVIKAVAEGSVVITAAAGKQTAECNVTVYPAYSYIDLGLSVNWGTYNLGAKAPEEAGNYYAWGECEPKENYSWSTYKWCSDGSSQNINKYNTKGAYGTPDNLTILQAEDDAASVQRGAKWRIPTQAEWQELFNNCNWVETTENGVKGFRVTGKNEKSIFLPRAGYYEGATLKNSTVAEYWSANLGGDPREAQYTYINGIWSKYFYNIARSSGLPVRPVMNHGYVAVESITLNKETLRLVIGRAFQLAATVVPSWATNNVVSWTSSNPSVASVDGGLITAITEGTVSITAKADDKEVICTVTVEQQKAPEAVDLGLSVKWASFNVGGNAPEDYGDYFAWGETEYKENYSWGTYKWCNDGSSQNLKKYNTNSAYGNKDGKTVLDLDDDVARTKLGGKWRTPTQAEWQELYNNCSWYETTVSGIPVFRIVGKNENLIVLPRAGYYEGATLKNSTVAEYWSANLGGDPREAQYTYINGIWSKYFYNIARSSGLPVRAVTE